jgi:ankyrin repeat protein
MTGPAALLVVLMACAAGCAREPMNRDRFDTPTLAPLARAVAEDDAAEVRRHLQGVDPDTPGADGATLLVEAIGQRKLASAKALLDGGADPNRPGGGGETPVHAAAFVDDPAFLKLVLEKGGDPNVANPVSGARPLLRAILGQNPAQVRMLLDAGADPNLADRNGDTPLHAAARTNAGAIILMLLDAGASPLAKNSGGATFQAYYFGFPRNVLNDRALAERRQVVAWLKAHQVPLEANVEAAY